MASIIQILFCGNHGVPFLAKFSISKPRCSLFSGAIYWSHVNWQHVLPFSNLKGCCVHLWQRYVQAHWSKAFHQCEYTLAFLHKSMKNIWKPYGICFLSFLYHTLCDKYLLLGMEKIFTLCTSKNITWFLMWITWRSG